MRVYRSSLRIAAGLALGLLTACGGGGSAPTPTAAATTAQPAVTAPSPQRPTLASPVASPSSGTTAAAATPSPTTAEVAGESYEVQSGDTLAIISQQYYGDPTQWRRIYDANKDTIGSDPDKLKVGMKLTIPPKAQ